MKVDISIIVPVFNEKENIPHLFKELIDALDDTHQHFEIIFVDDGSTDGTFKALCDIQERENRLIVIQLRRNFGQTAALAAGFDHARGRIIVTMDGDLQNDPKDIPLLLEKIDQGYDLVSGWRSKRKDGYFTRCLPSIVANRMISLVTRVNLHDYGCTLKAFRREVVENLKLYGEMHRFIPAIASGSGAEIAEVKVNHRPRRCGVSKYGMSRTIRVILDLITVKFLLSYGTRPIQVFGLLGITSGFIGFVIALIMTIQRQFFGVPLANRPMLLMAILLMFIGLQFVSLGLIGELQARTYHESQNKPVYIIREKRETQMDLFPLRWKIRQ